MEVVLGDRYNPVVFSLLIFLFKSKESGSQSIKSKLMCLVITWVATMNVFVSGSDPVGGW